MDHFGRLPDSLVIVIFDKVADARSLLRCSKVSKRFSGLVPLVHDVFLKIDWPVAEEDGLDLPLPPVDGPSSLCNLLNLMSSAAIRSYRYFQNANVDDDKFLSARQVLSNFTHVRNLKIELPPCSPGGGGGGGLITRDGDVLKWRAEFGSALQRCLVVAATIDQVTDFEQAKELSHALGISSLQSASTRHCQLLPIIMDHPTLRSVVSTDADGLGTLIMGAEQLKECRENPPRVVPIAGSPYKITLFPMFKRMSIYTKTRVPGGLGMQKVGIMVMKPTVEGDVKTAEEEVKELLVSGAFEGVFVDIAKELLKKMTTCCPPCLSERKPTR